jgi:predicted AAA+ superfamily ATPase
MYRKSFEFLSIWLNQKNSTRKPLVLKGARQVGKSTLVQQFCKAQQIQLIEVNLERNPKLSAAFETLNPERILNEIYFLTGKKIVEQKITAQSISSNPPTILFLDEIQAIPKAYQSLRYFFEQMPELPIIAAGSLLDVILNDEAISHPVGRLEFHYVSPMTFKEFLLAAGELKIIEYIEGFQWDQSASVIAHDQAIQLVRLYGLIGGMPEVVKAYVNKKSFKDIQKIQSDLMQTYRNDFAKYRKKITLSRLESVFDYASTHALQKVKYSSIDQNETAKNLKPAIALLENAQVIKCVHHSNGTRLPLKSQINPKSYKLLFLDVGLLSFSRDFHAGLLSNYEQLNPSLNGQISEHFIGQHLLYIEDGFFKPELNYWLREGSANNAEVDFLIQHESKIIPIEVKSVQYKYSKSMEQFAIQLKSKLGVCFCADPPAVLKTPYKSCPDFNLLKIPHYLVSELPRLLEF